MDGKSLIIGLIAGGCAFYYFSSKEKKSEDVKVIHTKTIHVNSAPEYFTQPTYPRTSQNIIYTPAPRIRYIAPQPIIHYDYVREPVFLPPHPHYRHFHHEKPHFHRRPHHFHHHPPMSPHFRHNRHHHPGF